METPKSITVPVWLLIWHTHMPDGSVECSVGEIMGPLSWVNHKVRHEGRIRQAAYNIKPHAGSGMLKVILHSITQLRTEVVTGDKIEFYQQLTGGLDSQSVCGTGA